MARIGYRGLELYWKPQLRGKPQLHRLACTNGSSVSPLAELVFQQFGLGYLICHKFPRVIETDFVVHEPVRRLIDEMYSFYDRGLPRWICPSGFMPTPAINLRFFDTQKVAVTLSGGKDGLYYLLRAIAENGKDNILPVHLARLSMEGVAHRELKAAKKLAELLGVNLKVIELTNSTRIPGPRIMHFRDLFLIAMLAGEAYEFGAERILMEGSHDSRESGHPFFSDLGSSERKALEILRGWGVRVRVESEDISEYEVLRRMYRNPSWARLMPHTHSCLRCDRLMYFSRRWHQEHLPRIGKRLYDGQCGSCFKCRVVTLARILWDRGFASIPENELLAYVNRTEEWRQKLGREYRGSWDFVNDPSLLQLIKEAKEYLSPAP